ncbi:uncharacterized protein LOC115727319 [Rhodamnia argentea]|uniref:Uncharacterized protein LOC115727319 n=1 Tax=Rhodamnia argentea TaxID=178133 RepID=A0ABM3HBK5_9MYRT|nr:uncharacterized protein LOC115727319 [Rhodamnia argentea]
MQWRNQQHSLLTRDRQLKELAFVASTSSLLKFGTSWFHQLSGKINSARNASALPVIRAESNTTKYFPDAKFYKIEAILRPWRILQASSLSSWSKFPTFFLFL